jgi:hypothetical protein
MCAITAAGPYVAGQIAASGVGILPLPAGPSRIIAQTATIFKDWVYWPGTLSLGLINSLKTWTERLNTSKHS